MAQNNRREIELALSITTANADALSKLQQDVKGLAKEGGDAAPAFQKLADELGQLATQAKQLTALEGLTQELQAAAAAQTEAAAKSGALKQTLVELTKATDAARAAERAKNLELSDAKRAVQEAQDAIAKLKNDTSDAGKSTAGYTIKLVDLKGALLAARAAKRDLSAQLDALKAKTQDASGAVTEQGRAYREAASDTTKATNAMRGLQAQVDGVMEKYKSAGGAADDLANAQRNLGTAASAVRTAIQGVIADQERLAQAERDAANEALRQSAIIADTKRRMAAQARAEADGIIADYQRMERAQQEAAQSAKAAGEAIGNAFGTVGQRSAQEIRQEIEKVREAMRLLSTSGAATGTELATAMQRGETAINGLQRELREVTGTLTMADRAANLFRNSLGQIAAGNLIADAVGAMVEKVKDLGKQFVTSITQLDTFRRALNAVYKDSNTTASQLEFLRKAAGDSGVAVGGLSASFVKFSASMKSANVPVEQSNALFASLTRAAGSLGLGAERTSLALDALSQIASKGVVSMEELRQQLGDSLPGALSLTAKGLGITDAELVKLVESGQLAARDFFPAFTQGLKELHGETQGLVPTWERLKNAFTMAAQNAGDAGWLEILTAGLKGLGLAAASVILPLSALTEMAGAMTRSLGVLAGAVVTLTNPMDALREIWGQAAERQAKLTEAFDATVLGVTQTSQATTQLTSKVQEVMAATDGLTNSQKLATVAAKLNGDATLDAAAKYVQLSIASATLIKQQENETLNLERVAKARKEEGETLIALAKLRGDEQGILDATLQAAEEYAVATAKVSASKAEELRILEQQLIAQQAKLVADKATAEQQEKETEKLRELIKTKQSEVEQTKASTEAAKQEVAARQLAVQMYGDQSAKMAEYRAEMDRLTLVLQEYEKLNINGKKTDEEVAAVRQKLAEITAKYKDTVNDLARNLRLQAAEEVATLKTKQASLSVDIQIAQASANIARLRGDNTKAMQLEREAMAKQIEVAKIKIEIDRVQAQLQIKLLENEKLKLKATDANYELLVKELDLKIKLQKATLTELDGADKLIRLKEEENRLRQKATNDLGSEAVARGNVTAASEKQSDAMAKMLMQYTMSADYSERQIALLEKEAAAEETLAEARRKRLNVDKEGYSLNTTGERVMAGETQEQVDKDIAELYGAANIDSPDAQRARQLRELSRLRSKGNGLVTQPDLSADERRELQGLEARLLNGIGAAPKDAQTREPTTAPTRTTASGMAPATQVTINLEGRARTITTDAAGANVLQGLLRELAAGKGTYQ